MALPFCPFRTYQRCFKNTVVTISIIAANAGMPRCTRRCSGDKQVLAYLILTMALAVFCPNSYVKKECRDAEQLVRLVGKSQGAGRRHESPGDPPTVSAFTQSSSGLPRDKNMPGQGHYRPWRTESLLLTPTSPYGKGDDYPEGS